MPVHCFSNHILHLNSSPLQWRIWRIVTREWSWDIKFWRLCPFDLFQPFDITCCRSRLVIDYLTLCLVLEETFEVCSRLVIQLCSWLCRKLPLCSLSFFEYFDTWFWILISAIYESLAFFFFDLNVVIAARLAVFKNQHPLKDIRLPLFLLLCLSLIIDYLHVWIIIIPCLISNYCCNLMLISFVVLRLFLLHFY